MGDQPKYCIFSNVWDKNISTFFPHRGHHLNGICLPLLTRQPLPDTLHATSMRLTKPLPDSQNLNKTHTTSTRCPKPLPDSLNPYQTDTISTRIIQPLKTHTISTRLTQPLLDSCNLYQTQEAST